MKKIWTIPVLTVYIYTITILAMYGYNSYFNIPYSFINTSITSNVVYIHFLVTLFFGLIGTIKWYQWLVLLVFGGTVILGYVFFTGPKKALSFLLFLVMASFMYASVSFGDFLASHESNFFTLSEDCKNIDVNKNYIISTFYNGDIILVSIDSNKRLENGLMIKKASELNCEIRMSYGLGPINK